MFTIFLGFINLAGMMIVFFYYGNNISLVNIADMIFYGIIGILCILSGLIYKLHSEK